MPPLGHILLAILLFGVSTVWVTDRWALSGLEAAVFLCAIWALLRGASRTHPASTGILPLLPGAMCLWGLLQLAARWTVVRADTTEAVLYWLAAAGLVWLGHQAFATRQDRQLFLKAALAAGFAVCLLGLVQLFTSDGKVFWLFPSGYDSEVIGPFVSRNNYACFVELLLPVALVLAFKNERNSKAYFAVAAALVASVIASGSRAGAVLVIAESALVFLLRRRAEKNAVGRRWVTFAVLTAAFTLVVGYQYLWDRLIQNSDPYETRREFVESSLAMVRAQPLHGFGLGTWPSAYRPFAIVDTGLIANHAHNEWAQWAAEGGLPALAVMLAILILCLPAAVQSVWGVGVIAVFLHSIVDYPFMRLGLAAWIFVFIGALSGYASERRRIERGRKAERRSPGLLARAVAAAAVPLLAFGIYQSVRLAQADILYHRATPDSVARAARLIPDRAEYHLALAQTDPGRARHHLEHAIELNPFLTTARIALASNLEAAGDTSASEAALLESVRRDKQYAPAWALTNFYFRNDRPDQFWRAARSAAQISYGGLRPLFDLCFLLTNDPQTVLDRVVVPRRIVEREYLAYLMDLDRLAGAHAAALRIATTAVVDDRDPLLAYVDRTLECRRPLEALAIWNQLCQGRLVPYPPTKPGDLVNGDFRQPILDRAFDWRLPPAGCAVAAQTRSDSPALEIVFSGKQPETCQVLDHFLPLTKGTQYVLQFQYRTRDLPGQTGLQWSVGSGPVHQFAASEWWSTGEWRFQADADAARLVLTYRRAPGTRRIEGTMLLRQVWLKEVRLKEVRLKEARLKEEQGL